MAQVVDCSEIFIDIFVGILDNVNDSRVLCKTCTLKLNTMGCLSLAKIFKMGFFLYILGDKGYPLISWIMTPYEKRLTFYLRTFI
jgi:hypothetical protein